MRKIGLFLLFFTASASTFANDKESPYRLIVGNKDGKTSLNDDPSILSLAKPYVYFQWQGQKSRIRAIIGGLYNKLEFQRSLADKFGLFIDTESSITLAGDSPRIDGVDLDAFEFKAHRFGGSLGGYYNPHRKISIRSGLKLDYFYIYDTPSGSVNFVSPRNFFQQGPYLNVLYGKSIPPTELFENGFRAHLYSAYKFRSENRSWGVSGFEKNVGSFAEASLGFSYSRQITRPLFWSLAAQGSMLSKADRLNTIKDGEIKQKSTKMFLGNVRADRSFTGELGLRWYVAPKRYFAIKPFGHFAAYREVTPTGTRTDQAYGPAITLMGHIDNYNFLWDITYGAAFGHRADLDGLHDVKLSFSYRFL